MKTKLFLTILTFFVIQFTNAQAPTAIWQKCYGGSNDDYIGAAAVSTEDGGYLIGLGTKSNDGDISGNHGNNDISIIKLNATGIVQWQKCYGGTGTDHISGLIATTAGGYLIYGYTDSNDDDVSGNHSISGDIWIVKINAVGTILWQKCLGGDTDDHLYQFIRTSDGGFIGVGRTSSINNGDVLGNTAGGAWVVKIDSSGVIQWQKVYQDVAHITSVLQKTDGSYVYAGSVTNPSFPSYHGNGDVWVAKVNQGGTIQWQKCYGGSGYEDGNMSIISSNDGGYLFSSLTESNDGDVYGNHGQSDCWVVKLDISGTILEQNCYGGSARDDGGNFQKTADGGFLISIQTNSNDGDVFGNHGGYDAWSIKFSAAGAVQWQKCFGGTNDDYGGAFQLADGTYMAGGSTFSNNGDIAGNHNATTSDGFLIKLTAANLANENFIVNTFTTYPNPVTDSFTIDFGTTEMKENYKVKVTNMLGQEVYENTLQAQQTTIPVKWSHQGMYLVNIIDNQGTTVDTRKIIIQ